MKKTTTMMLCLVAACACGDTKITWLADVTADRAETVTGAQSNDIAAAAAHIPRADNPHGVTATQIGALTNEQDLAALRAYHYGSPDIVESPSEWFVFDWAGTITAFNWEAGRTNVVIPWAIGGVPVTAIGANAFYMRGIVSVIAPQTVTTIGSEAFYYCSALISVTIPQATSIGSEAFYYCSALISVTIPQATSIGYAAFSQCNWLTSVTIPQATSIGDGAFSACNWLTSITIPQATSIGDYAFYFCTTLTAVHMGQNAPAEAADVFADIDPPPTVYVTDPHATGWGDTWNGAPVVRPPLYGSNVTAQAFTLGGDTITEWPAGGATNITDGVTSGTYTEATRTLDISNLLAGVSMELPEGIVTNGWLGSTVKINNLEISQWPGLPTRTWINCNDYCSFAFQGAQVFYLSPVGASWPQNKMATFGGNEDVSLSFDGTDFVIDSARVGHGKTRIKRDTIVEGANTAAAFVTTGTVSAASAILRDSGQPVSWEFSVSNGLFYASTNGVRAYKLTVEAP